jgi:hypothetical protein
MVTVYLVVLLAPFGAFFVSKMVYFGVTCEAQKCKIEKTHKGGHNKINKYEDT